jgi:tetratricopeptide (TPR) repeat protein
MPMNGRLSPRQRRLVGGTLGILGLAVVSLGTYLVRGGRSGANAAVGDQVILADLDNVTGDSLFDRSLIAAAVTGLQQSARVRLYPRARLAAIYRLMKLDTPVTLTYELAKEVAERGHVPFVVALRVARDGPSYRVSARLADVAHERELGEVVATSPIEREVVGALGDVLLKARRVLGETRREIADRRTPLPLVTTASLEALRSYADGSSAWMRSDYDRAREHWLRAVDLDTGFALALSALGSTYYYLHDRYNGERYYAAAQAHADRLSEWERLRMLQSRASFRGHSDSALVLEALMAQRYPSVQSWYDYGTGLMRAGRSEDAIAALRKAIALDSTNVNSWINLATSYDRQFAERIRAYEHAGALDTTVLYKGNINHEYGKTLLLAGRPDDAERVFRKMAEVDRMSDRALGWRSLGYLAFWQGKIYEAIGDFQQAVAATQQMDAALSEGRNRLLVASAYRAANRIADAEVEVNRALALTKAPVFEPVMLALVLYSCEQLDRVKDVEAMAALIKQRADSLNPRDRASVALATGAVFVVRHQPDSAIKYLRLAKGYPLPIPRLMMLAAAFDAKGQRDSVRATLEAVTATEGFGVEGQDDYLRAPLVLGDILLQSKDTAGARRRYQEFVTRWKDAPNDIPDLVTARAKLAALGRAAK